MVFAQKYILRAKSSESIFQSDILRNIFFYIVGRK